MISSHIGKGVLPPELEAIVGSGVGSGAGRRLLRMSRFHHALRPSVVGRNMASLLRSLSPLGRGLTACAPYSARTSPASAPIQHSPSAATSSRATNTGTRCRTSTCATSSSRSSPPATRPQPPRWPGPATCSPTTRRGHPPARDPRRRRTRAPQGHRQGTPARPHHRLRIRHPPERRSHGARDRAGRPARLIGLLILAVRLAFALGRAPTCRKAFTPSGSRAQLANALGVGDRAQWRPRRDHCTSRLRDASLRVTRDLLERADRRVVRAPDLKRRTARQRRMRIARVVAQPPSRRIATTNR
jgi:hypothetical protein